MIAKEIIQQLNRKSKWFDIIEIDGTSTPISFKNSRVHSIVSKQNSGFGIRVNIDGKTGFSFTNDITAIKDTANRAIMTAPYGEKENFQLPEKTQDESGPYNKTIEDFNTKEEIEKGNNAIDRIKSEFPLSQIDIGINKYVGSMRLKNSKDLELSYKSSSYTASISATIIMEDGSKVDIWESKTRSTVESWDELVARLIEKLNKSTMTVKAKSGKIPVILTPKAFARISGIVLSGLNAHSVYKKISPFENKIGETVFHKNLTITDDPNIKDSPFNYPFDDEGILAKDKNLIANGVIESFITDLRHAERLNIEPTGNGSRGYSSLPSPSFSNIIIANGSKSKEELFKEHKQAVLIDQFIGLGQSNTLTGDFSASLDLAYLIEDGEIIGRVKDCMISDNLFKLLGDDILLSRDSLTSGSISVPYILFPQVNYTC